MRVHRLVIAMLALAPLTVIAEDGGAPAPSVPATDTPAAPAAAPEAPAVQLETFSLADGRTLTGTFDSASDDILVPGPIAFRVHVETASIVARRPATADEIVAIQPKEAKPRHVKTPEEKAKDEERRKAAESKAADDQRLADEHRRAKAAKAAEDKHKAEVEKVRVRREAYERQENEGKARANPPMQPPPPPGPR